MLQLYSNSTLSIGVVGTPGVATAKLPVTLVARISIPRRRVPGCPSACIPKVRHQPYSFYPVTYGLTKQNCLPHWLRSTIRYYYYVSFPPRPKETPLNPVRFPCEGFRCTLTVDATCSHVVHRRENTLTRLDGSLITIVCLKEASSCM